MRTGFIAILGRPNVGKSTLLNAMLGEKIAIVSKKPQTTRTRITGILTRGEDQFVFLDTPGMIKSRNKLGDYMVKTISNTIGEVDACLFVVEAGVAPGATEKNILERIGKRELPAILVINKTDKRRSSYYNLYTGNKWGKYDNYDMAVNSSTLGIEGTAHVIVASVKRYLED